LFRKIHPGNRAEQSQSRCSDGGILYRSNLSWPLKADSCIGFTSGGCKIGLHFSHL